jgi:DNA-binding MarR family transcriptional regulator
LIITIVFMNFYIDLSRVALALYPIYRPPKEQPIMKRQLLASFVLSVLATSAFALPAAEQATPQVKADASHVSQTLARSGASDKNNTDYNGSITENGSEQANKRAYTEGVAEGGRDRLEQKGLVEGGADRLMERNAVAEGGRDRLEQKGLVEDGSSRANKRAYADGVAEGGADRLQELHQAQS